jgi:prepilin-type N-terminal cleavage/methylation domain-containing protein
MHIKKAFTMIELVFVIVVMGIIAAVALPRFDSDNAQEAMDQILSDIRYTQHLALVDNVIDPTDLNWQRAFWSIHFEHCGGASGWFYMVGSDSNYGGDIDKIEAARDLRSGKPMFWKNTDDCSNGGDGTVSEKVFISKKFGINNITFAGGCAGGQYFGFDSFGRPHAGFTTSATPNYDSIMTNDCNMTFSFDNHSNMTIQIRKETGYASIVGQGDQ